MYTDGGSTRSVRREPGGWFDAAFVCAIMLTSLLPLFIKSFTGVFFILIPALYAYFRLSRVRDVVVRSLPIMAIGAWCLISAFWSPYPDKTIYYGIQMWLTLIAGCMFGAGTNPRQATYGLFAAMFIHGMAVLFYGLKSGGLVLLGSSLEPFVGLAGSKNTTADMAALGVLSALAMMVSAISRVRPVELLLALVLLAVDLLIVYRASSAGAYAALALGMAVFLACWAMRPWAVKARVVVVFLAAISGLAAAATRSVWYPVLFESYLAAAGKDESLTGRTYVWSRADVLIEQHPAFGRGFASFWVEGDLEPTAIWDAMFVSNHVGFNFHNSVLEVLVYFGYTGLAAISLIVIGYALLLARRLVIDPQPITIMFASLIAYDALRFNFESLPLGIFAHNTLFLYGALSHAVRVRTGKQAQAPAATLPARVRLGPRRIAIRTGI